MLKALLIIYNIVTITSVKEWWEDSKAIELTADNFYDYVGTDKYVIVEFFTKWCQYCRMLKPEYDKLVDVIKQKRNDMVVTRCDIGTHSSIGENYGIFVFPIIAMFYPEDRKIKKVYRGERNCDDMCRAFTENIPFYVKKNLKVNKVNDNFKGYGNETEQDLMEVTDIKEFFINEINEIKRKIKEFEQRKIQTIEDYNKYLNNKMNRKIKNEIIIKIGLFEVSIGILCLYILYKIYAFFYNRKIANADNINHIKK